MESTPGPRTGATADTSFEMWAEQAPTHVVMHLRGPLEMGSADMVCQQICAAAAVVTPPVVVVAFSEVTHMDCSGLGAVMVIWEQVRDARGLLILASLPGFFRDLFGRLGPDRHLAICDSLAQAAALARRPPPDGLPATGRPP